MNPNFSYGRRENLNNLNDSDSDSDSDDSDSEDEKQRKPATNGTQVSGGPAPGSTNISQLWRK